MIWDVEETNKLQSGQELLYRLFDFYGPKISDDCCENCNKVDFCTTSGSVSNNTEILTVQKEWSRYDPMNSRIRKLIPNLKIEDTIAFEHYSKNIHGIIWHQEANAIRGHYTCTFKVNGKWIFVSDTHIQEIHSYIYLLIYQHAIFLTY